MNYTQKTTIYKTRVELREDNLTDDLINFYVSESAKDGGSIVRRSEKQAINLFF